MKLRYEERIDQMIKSHEDDVENMQDQITELQGLVRLQSDEKTEQSK